MASSWGGGRSRSAQSGRMTPTGSSPIQANRSFRLIVAPSLPNGVYHALPALEGHLARTRHCLQARFRVQPPLNAADHDEGRSKFLRDPSRFPGVPALVQPFDLHLPSVGLLPDVSAPPDPLVVLPPQHRGAPRGSRVEAAPRGGPARLPRRPARRGACAASPAGPAPPRQATRRQGARP